MENKGEWMTNFKIPVSVSLPLLKEFVYEAKRRAFAFTDDKTTLPDQTSVYSYRPFSSEKYPGMIYADMYSGNTIEGGQESVTIDLVLRWRNQYYGGTKAAFWDLAKSPISGMISDPIFAQVGSRFPEVVSCFLKMALMNMTKDFPVRGPLRFRSEEVDFEGIKVRGEWLYTNTWKGVSLYDNEDPFTSYSGEEKILYNGIEVYWHAYHGGLIRDKYFPLMVQPK